MTAWSPQQEIALQRASRWLSQKTSPYFLLAGYAGTGKTTLAKELAAGVGGEVFFAAFTGKAASVLARTGVKNVSTIHQLIYTTRERSRKRLEELEREKVRLLRAGLPTDTVSRDIARERNNLAKPSFTLNTDSVLKKASLLVLDEYSMIDDRVGHDLLSFGVPVLALGDPGQLPPVRGRSFFTQRPDVMLTEIHRQAEGNPIIWLSREIREGRPLRSGTYGDSRVVSRRSVDRETLAELVLSREQLLVGRNDTRRASNARVRELKGLGGVYPKQGDKLVCLRNNHEVGVMNGQLWTATCDSVPDDKYVAMAIAEDGTDLTKSIAVSAHAALFKGQEVDAKDIRDADCFDYGYALTVHKAQGSQWNSVVLFDEWEQAHRKEWLYTGVTRARERVDVVLM